MQVTLSCGDRLILAKWSEKTGIEWLGKTVDTIFTDLMGYITTADRPALGLTINGSTGKTLASYSIENDNIYEKLWELANIVNWQFYYNAHDDKVIFEARGTPTAQLFYNKAAGSARSDQTGASNPTTWTGKTINVLGLIKWSDNSSELVNNFRGYGGQLELQQSESKAITTSPTYGHIFTTAYTKIYDVTASTVYNGGKTFTQGTEYNVASSGGLVFLDKSILNAYSGGTLVITYTTKKEASSTAQTSTSAGSKSTYIQRDKTSIKRNIVDSTDMSAYLTQLLSGFSSPITDTTFEVRDSVTSPVIGSPVSVYDGIVGRYISSTYTPAPYIIKVIKTWPRPTTTTTISTRPLKYDSQEQTTYDRVVKTDRELNKTNTSSFFKLDGTTPITHPLYFGSVGGDPVQLITPVIHNLAADPYGGAEGQLYHNTTSHTPKYFNGTTWSDFGSGTITGTGADNTVAIWNGTTGLDYGHAANDLSFDSYSGIKFYYGVGKTYAGDIRSFNGVTNSSLLINSPNGTLQLSGNTGIKFASSVVSNIAMSGYKVTGLAAAASNGDAVRYEQLFGAFLPIGGGTLTGTLTSRAVTPVASGSYDSGSTTYRWNYVNTELCNIWNTLYINSPDEITFGAITHSNAEELTFTVAAGGKFKFVVSA